MRVGVQHFLFAGRAARVDKPRKEEAAGAGCEPMEKERWQVWLTLPCAQRRSCWVCQQQSFSAIFVASAP